MPTYFLLNYLSGGYTVQDLEISGALEEYLTDVLEIPFEIIMSMELVNRKIELQLYNEEWIANEDWYYTLVKFSRIQDLSA